MTSIYIALKDLKRQFRSPFAVAFMFVLPLATAGLIGLAFSGLLSEDGGFDIARTTIVISNQDQAIAANGGFSMGDTLLEVFQSEGLSTLFEIQIANSPQEAHTVFESGQAGAAVFIPAGLTEDILINRQQAAITFEQDPALILGPDIARAIISDFVDGFSASIIAGNIIEQQLSGDGITLSQGDLQALIGVYAQWVQDVQTTQEGQSNALITTEVVRADHSRQSTPFEDMISDVVVGMLIFYAFFSGAAGAQSIIQEDEDGTLSRMFTTPASAATILGGKFLNIFVTVLVQIVVTLAASALIFNTQWGSILPLAAAVIALNVVAAGFGLMLISPLKSTRQAGAVMGIVLTMTGMAGGLMTTGFSNMPDAFTTLTQFIPQGWALQTFRTAMVSSHLSTVLSPALVTIAIGVVCFAIGTHLFRRRFI